MDFYHMAIWDIQADTRHVVESWALWRLNVLTVYDAEMNFKADLKQVNGQPLSYDAHECHQSSL